MITTQVKVKSKSSEASKRKAKEIFLTIASLGLAIFLGGIGIGLMFWLMS